MASPVSRDDDGPVNNTDDVEAVLAANMAFYLALEQGDLEGMGQVWADGADVTCAHPGRGPIRGWDEVRRSWAAIFANAGNPQVIVTDAEATLRGDVAWVTATENLLAGAGTSVATALNVFHRGEDGWRMVAHQAGPLLG